MQTDFDAGWSALPQQLNQYLWQWRNSECGSVSVRAELGENGLPVANRVLFGDTGFDDTQLFDLCLTPVLTCAF